MRLAPAPPPRCDERWIGMPERRPRAQVPPGVRSSVSQCGTDDL